MICSKRFWGELKTAYLLKIKLISSGEIALCETTLVNNKGYKTESTEDLRSFYSKV